MRNSVYPSDIALRTLWTVNELVFIKPSGEYIQHDYNMPLLHETVASASISLVPTTPLTELSSIASTTASATRSGFSGFSTAAPAIHDRRPPIIEFTMFPTLPAAAIGMVNIRDES